jgi:hypothetical protein
MSLVQVCFGSRARSNSMYGRVVRVKHSGIHHLQRGPTGPLGIASTSEFISRLFLHLFLSCPWCVLPGTCHVLAWEVREDLLVISLFNLRRERALKFQVFVSGAFTVTLTSSLTWDKQRSLALLPYEHCGVLLNRKRL